MSARKQSPKRLCQETKWLAEYLKTDFDPYDFDWAVERWKNSKGYRNETWETHEDIPEGPRKEYFAWAKHNLLNEMYAHMPLDVPAYFYFEKPELIPPRTWLVHYSRERFWSFDRGTTLEHLALSTHAKPSMLKSCKQNLSPSAGTFDIVWGFAVLADGDWRNQRIAAKAYGNNVMLFQSDCGVHAYHNTDMQYQVIFPLCSEYNLRVGTFDGQRYTFEGKNSTGMQVDEQEFDSLPEVIDAIKRGKLVKGE